MTPKEAAAFLKCKTILEVKFHKYLKWDMCVDEIILTDGTVIDVCGNADYGRFEGISFPDGYYESIYEDGVSDQV